MSAILEATQVQAFYGSTCVLKGIDFSVASGGITTILGANGAGKTTILRAISRMVRTTGQISFEGRRIDTLSTERVAKAGIAHVPDGRGTLSALTVEENLRIGAYTRWDSAAKRRDFDRVYE
jgi:branched-chain amino acid transport system ATP-binding protein